MDGYNLSYLKPDATAAAYSGDEYAAPLVAFWQRGLGRAAAVSFPLGGEFSQRARAWPQYGDFLQTLARWLMGSDVPAGLALRPRVDGSELGLDLFYDASWEERLAADRAAGRRGRRRERAGASAGVGTAGAGAFPREHAAAARPVAARRGAGRARTRCRSARWPPGRTRSGRSTGARGGIAKRRAPERRRRAHRPEQNLAGAAPAGIFRPLRVVCWSLCCWRSWPRYRGPGSAGGRRICGVFPVGRVRRSPAPARDRSRRPAGASAGRDGTRARERPRCPSPQGKPVGGTRPDPSIFPMRRRFADPMGILS